ncbi:MAG: cupin domain-containing protein [Smithellaceae bacterium]|nr:cupin domain-containing protein [Smithellaceae bacterium]MDD3259870.1 cupin domain-containing protein [Smithellaceae bacterium]MDD3849248.1 cupin domain-containing protein [Smithellaceae bacterium]
MHKNRVWAGIALLILMPLWAWAGEYNAGVQSNIILRAETMSNGEPIDYLDTDRPQVTVMTVDIAPGAGTGWHSHPMPVYAYVMAGQLTVEIEGGKTAEFMEGDAIIEVVNLRHNGTNHGKVPVKLLVFYLGAKDVPNVIKGKRP